MSGGEAGNGGGGGVGGGGDGQLINSTTATSNTTTTGGNNNNNKMVNLTNNASGGGCGTEEKSPQTKGALCRILLTDGDFESLSSADLANRWKAQDCYVTCLEQRLAQQEGELSELRQTVERTRGQLNESQQREKVLVRRLAAKEQETQDYLCQLNELKSAQAPTNSSLRSSLLDPAVNSLLQQLRQELQATRSRLEDTQNELAAWKFTPDSNTGKRLMAKCRLLYQENEELGKMTSSGRVATLEGDLALQKGFSEEVRQSQLELDSFLADMDEDVEGMQSTILFLQQELRRTKDAAQLLQKENGALKAVAATAAASNGRANGDSTANVSNNNGAASAPASVCDEQERTDSESSEGGAAATAAASATSGDRTPRVSSNKRVRRSSVLSIDYNEDDALVINANGDVAMSSDAE